MVFQNCDAVVCISQTTADLVAEYYKETKLKRKKPLNLYYFHMGSNIVHSENREQIARPEIMKFVKQTKTFLMVGTVEPRKGHEIAIEAFKLLVKENKNVQLLIIGHNGWKNDEFRKLLEDNKLGESIMWISDASDEELNWAYRNAEALIAASKDEGFGLPLIESAQFGLPIICSDIPIFKEVAGVNATYFKAMDILALKETIVEWLKVDKHPESKKIKLYTWAESAREILDIVNGNIKPYKILE